MKPEKQKYIHFYDDEHHVTTMHTNTFTSACEQLPNNLKIIQIASQMYHPLNFIHFDLLKESWT